VSNLINKRLRIVGVKSMSLKKGYHPMIGTFLDVNVCLKVLGVF
jgi:hypothetical protein